MLDILDGRTHCRWRLVDSVDEAQVIVAGFSGGRSGLSDWRHPNKHLVAIVESSDVRPQTPFVLTHPFRVMQVLSILNEIADLAMPVRARAVSSTEEWEFAQSVRALSGQPVESAWYRCETADGREVLVAAAQHGYASEAGVIEQICRGKAPLSALVPTRVQTVPAQYERRPMAELLWHNAYHASAKLAPWLDAGAAYRARRWPDFGVIPATRPRLQLVAALSARALNRSELVAMGHMAPSEVDRLLNALSLCDLIASERSATSPAERNDAQARPAGFLRALIGGLRQRLGMG
jgi:hypothetical protein